MNLKERIQHITGWITNLFSHIPTDIKRYAAEALKITTAIRGALDSDIAKIITDVVPGEWDNDLRLAAIKLLNDFSFVFVHIGESNAAEDVKKAAQDALLSKVQSGLIALQDGKSLPQNRYDLYAQLSYSVSKQ